MAKTGRPPGRANLSGMHLRIWRLHMAGATNLKIASELGVSAQTVSIVLNNDFFKQAKQDVVENVIRNVASGNAAVDKFSPITIAKAAAPRMMQLNMAIAESPKVAPQTRLRAIHDILDRACGKATQHIVTDNVDSILERCTDNELEHYSKTGELPDWAGGENGTVH